MAEALARGETGRFKRWQVFGLTAVLKNYGLRISGIIRAETEDGGVEYYYATQHGVLYPAVLAAVRPGFEAVYVPPLDKYALISDGGARWIDGGELARLLHPPKSHISIQGEGGDIEGNRKPPRHKKSKKRGGKKEKEKGKGGKHRRHKRRQHRRHSRRHRRD
jgi:hypothetical protein